ncbi:MAG TPA: 1-acyl-sn-glycerol-3-phosphate acyltransferase [Bacteroides sp.]|nr:1-acyl-sn-glycerol-3-phosphate acyltransferase [Bacteroides sp.]
MSIMRKAGLTVYSYMFWIFFAITSLVYFVIAEVIWLITKLFDRRLLIHQIWSCYWASSYIFFNPLWRVRVSGRNKIPWRRPCILVANHQSMVDILVLFLLFRPFKWISKKENFSIPIIGWHMRISGHIELERGRNYSLVKLMEKASDNIRKGNSLMIFPEGTRYPGEKLGPFKDGAFRMALEGKVDIIPIVIEGTAKALPKKGAILTGFTKINVKVLDPIPYSSFEGKPVRELMHEVRDIMSEEYDHMHSKNTSI